MRDIYEMLLGTYAAIGQEMSDIGIKTIAHDLKDYEPQAVGVALIRCRKELRRISLADIICRIPGEHPGPEEAWGLVAKVLNDENPSIAWTEPMRLAYGAAYNLAADPIAARMAFKEAYVRHISEARALGERPTWEPSLGHDPGGRDDAMQQAQSLNLLANQSLKQLSENIP